MRILFVPMHDGGASHIIPLVKLIQSIKDNPDFETAMLLSKSDKDDYGVYLDSLGITILDLNHVGVASSEVNAYTIFKADIVVDDFSLSTGYACQLYPRARVTVIRNGSFPFTSPLNKNHKHSFDFKDFSNAILNSMGLKAFSNLSDFFIANARIVPGIKSIEILPSKISEDRSYYFSGPLIHDDLDISDELKRFFEINKHKRKVYFTYGTVQKAPPEIIECIRLVLLDNNVVVSNVLDEKSMIDHPGAYYFSSYLPMNYVCSNVDLIIHHCGSGTYHYPILHKVSTITIGTECFDRDDIAIRLATLGVSSHIGSPRETDNFSAILYDTIRVNLTESDIRNEQRSKRFDELIEEIYSTRKNFNFSAVLMKAYNDFNLK